MDMTREEIIAQLLDTMNVAKRSMFGRMQTMMQDCPVSPAQLELLSNIAHLQPISAKLLARHLQLSPGAISQLVDGLQQHHLITRAAQPEDRRVHVLNVSARGKALLDRMIKPRQQFMEQLMSQMTDEELVVWLHIQEKMITQFQAFTAETNKESA